MSGFTQPHPAFVALGSNLGDSVEILQWAFERLQTRSDSPLLKSSLWRSQPIACPPGSPDFVNAVAAMQPKPGETSESLLAWLLELELEQGPRPRHFPNEPRLLDLDLLAVGDETRVTSDLTLPHPRAIQRRFVLAPWAEIAPDFVVPGTRLTVRQHLERLPDAPRIERVAGGE